MVEIARVTKGNNNIETARAFAQCECFKFNTIAEIAETMRLYKREGMLILTETEAILYHDC